MYQITVDGHTQQQLDALPAQGQAAWRELRAVLEVAPWNGEPLHPKTPDGVLTWQFGPDQEGLAYYLVIEHARQVAVLQVHWFG
ncbi:MAG: hypothetical protein JO296_14865 [Pseudonocardiales bacterium]|nr:hypothetical protein [Pseudonocardiales bacterium]